MTTARPQCTAMWPPIALAAWQEMWRMYNNAIPMPAVLDLPRCDGIRSVVERDRELRDIHAALVASGYAVDTAHGVRLGRAAHAMLQVLARPSREVDLRMDIREVPVRAFAAAPRVGDVVRVRVDEHEDVRRSHVTVETVRTSSPALAAVDLLPDSPGPGRFRALHIPVDQLERVIGEFRSDRFVDELRKYVGGAVGDVHDLMVRRGHTMRAKFGLAALDRDGNRARHPSAVVVHDSIAGRHVLAQLADHLTIDRVRDHQIVTMLEQRLTEQVNRRC